MVSVPTAREALSNYSITLEPGMDLLEAIQVLVGKRATGAPVVGANGELVGVLTEKDCLRLLSNAAWGEVAGGTVGDYMSDVKATVPVEMDLFSAAQAFLDNNFPILPLMDGDKLVGRITRQDLLRQILKLDKELDRRREREIERLSQEDSPEAAERLETLAASSAPELAERLEEDA